MKSTEDYARTMTGREPVAPWTRVFNSSALAALFILALNAYLARALFRVTFTEHLNSIEGAFIAIARYVSANWSDFKWSPLWHCGLPFENTYVPGLHVMVAAFGTITHVDAARAYHIVTALTYILGPVTLFWLVKAMRGSTIEAFFTALIYSLFSPSAVLIRIIRDDIHSVFHARRFQVLTLYGEGPHITAVAVIPLVIAGLQLLHEKRTPRRFAFAAFAWGALVLVNQPGTVAGIVIAYCWLVAHPPREFWRAACECASTALTGVALAVFALPPSAIINTVRNVGVMHRSYAFDTMHALVLLAVGGIAFALNFLLLKYNAPLRLRFGLITSATLMIIVLTADQSRFELLPQCGRYHLEMEMGLCLVAGTVLVSLMPRQRLPHVLFVALLIAASIFQIRKYSNYMTFMARPIDVTTRSEYVSARWVQDNMSGARVYATGSTAFWLNAFSDSPQLTGCCDQSMGNRFVENIPYLVNISSTPTQYELTRKWLQAYGVRAIIANTPSSTEEYRDFHNAEKFDGILPILHREAGDIIYGVPARSPGIAHAILQNEAISAVPTVLEDPQLDRYLSGIEHADRPEVKAEWMANSKIRLTGNLAPEHLISVQVAYARGWRATVNQQPRNISTDGLGNIIVRPECAGPCTIDLVYHGPPDKPFAIALSAIVFLLLSAGMFRNTELRRSSP